MSWDVHLWCNQCGGGMMIGVINNVTTGTARVGDDFVPYSEIRIQMRKHETEVHGGKS